MTFYTRSHELYCGIDLHAQRMYATFSPTLDWCRASTRGSNKDKSYRTAKLHYRAEAKANSFE